MVAVWVVVAVTGVLGDSVPMKFIPEGAMVKAGGYRPFRAEMNGKPDLVKEAPEGLEAPKYGELSLDGATWAFILDEPDGKPARLFIDTNDDGDLTNDPVVTWTGRKNGELQMYSGNAKIDLGAGKIASIGLYRFDPKDPQRAVLKNTLMFYTDFGYEVTLDLDGQSFTSFISGKPAVNTSLWIDRDGNKQQSYKREMVSVGKPFNFTGTTYVIDLDGDQLKLDKAAEPLPMSPLPPDLSVGKKTPEFEMMATDGTKISFPKTYAGKLVMLDFWATWCGPCIGELPNVKNAYEAWHDKGFEILGISFDNAGMEEKLAKFTQDKGMTWRQIYEGKQWNTTLGDMYDVSAIPFVLLIDGDTGEIVATTRELRGPGLSDFVGKSIEKKFAKQ